LTKILLKLFVNAAHDQNDDEGGKKMAGTKDPDVHLIVDGVLTQAQSTARGVYAFQVPSGARQVIIASRSVVPREIHGDALPDPRRLGVPVHRIVLKGRMGPPIEIGPNHPGLTELDPENETVG
jgi:hypothetical protein